MNKNKNKTMLMSKVGEFVPIFTVFIFAALHILIITKSKIKIDDLFKTQ